MVDTQLISDLKALRQVWDSKQWIKYAMSMDECGQTCVHPIKDAAAVCLVGGIHCVLEGTHSKRVETLVLALSDRIAALSHGEYLSLTSWNDRQKSVKDIRKLIDAAIREKEKELWETCNN